MNLRRNVISKLNTLNFNSNNFSNIKDLIFYLMTHDNKFDNVDLDKIDLDSIAISYKDLWNDYKDNEIRYEILYQEIHNELLLNKYKYNDYTNKYHYTKLS